MAEPLKQTPGQLVTNRGPATHQQEGSLASPIDRGTPTSCFPAAARGSWCSLPLMGIGNFQSPCSRRSRPGRPRPRAAHYPSWGSETAGPRVRREPDRYVRVLITPHGDRKPCEPRRRSRSACRSHYPSWGSETRLARLDAARPSLLITPHGDRKRCDPLACGRDAAARPRCSLPLMGIGNLRQDRAASSRCVRASLPLMGIGNPAISYQVAAREQQIQLALITPHGDRKPPRGSACDP